MTSYVAMKTLQVQEQKDNEIENLAAQNGRLEQIIASQAQEIARLQQQLSQAQRYRRDLTQVLSHDFKNLISGITTFLQMINGNMITTDDPNFQELSQSAEETTWELLEALEHLVDIYRTEDGNRRWVNGELEVPSLLKRIAADFSKQARQLGVTLKLEAPPYLTVQGDRWLIERILKNLVSNALKFVKRGGRVVISAQLLPSGKAVAISVKDNGPGLSQEEQALVFDIFYRNAEHQSSGRKGVGIGLTFSRKAAELMNGALEVESKGIPGLGSTFKLILPGAQVTDDE
ncbi:MAG: sensor histidine kinase [Anaerolineae bacterium]